MVLAACGFHGVRQLCRVNPDAGPLLVRIHFFRVTSENISGSIAVDTCQVVGHLGRIVLDHVAVIFLAAASSTLNIIGISERFSQTGR